MQMFPTTYEVSLHEIAQNLQRFVVRLLNIFTLLSILVIISSGILE